MKMSMSKNWMKINLKEVLPERTFVRPEVYETKADCMDMTLRGFCALIVQEFKDSGDKALTNKHVSMAYLKERFKEAQE